MEGKDDKTFCLRTYECSGGIKIHSYIFFKTLDDLKAQLKEKGYTSVGLVKFGWFDESENRIRSGIKTDNLTSNHVAWCTEKSVEDRYLAIYRK